MQPSNKQTNKYQHCLVMAGGGFHFGYYLGIYAALCELGKKPDVILASCGGAIAAAIVQALPNDAERKAWLCSPQMYAFWRGLKSKQNARMTHAFAGAMKRRFLGHNAKYIPDLFNDYLFEIPAQLPLPPRAPNTQHIDVAIVAGKLLYGENEVGQLRNSRKLFSEILFCDERAAVLVDNLQAPLSASQFGNTAVAAQLLTDVTMPISDAVRASIADMYYFRCHSHASGNAVNNYVGGVIDLFPIEVASQLAENVTMELKGFYDKTYGLPAVRTVLGFDGNQRLSYVLQQHADAWVNTADMERYFFKQRIRQKLIWHKNKIDIVAPPTFDAYLKVIEAQWNYGYQRAGGAQKAEL
jgi:predicted acylesterase/phospholipase RssA